MVVTHDSSELSPSPTQPTFVRQSSLDHESTMEITSAVADTRLGESEAPGAPMTPEKEKQGDDGGHTQGPTISSSMQLIGINYFPESTNVQATSFPPSPQHPTPWECTTVVPAASPSSEDHIAIGVSTFPPKPCVSAFSFKTCNFVSTPNLFSFSFAFLNYLFFFWVFDSRLTLLSSYYLTTVGR
ncbi:hypothetical protein BC827DRAFT_936706 [Russula dissimulans]|nr:hypothetical protein BC827DRAFT_936706 [Russula dissimulans]